VQHYQQPAPSAQQQQQPRPQVSKQYSQGQQHEQQHLQPVRPPPAHQRGSHSKSRTFSFQSQKSHKSHKSSGSKDNPLHETHEEKEAKRLHSKADPSLAISEAEPCTFILTSIRACASANKWFNSCRGHDTIKPRSLALDRTQRSPGQSYRFVHVQK
jgi:hypothetical protein